MNEKKTVKGYFADIWKNDKLLIGALVFLFALGMFTIKEVWWMGVSFFLIFIGAVVYSIVFYLRK